MWMGIHSHLLTRYDWMSREHGSYCWWFRNPKQPTEMVLKHPVNTAKKRSESTSTGFDRRISEPSTGMFIVKKFLWSGDCPHVFLRQTTATFDGDAGELGDCIERMACDQTGATWYELVITDAQQPKKKTSKNIGRNFGGISPNCGLKTWVISSWKGKD